MEAVASCRQKKKKKGGAGILSNFNEKVTSDL